MVLFRWISALSFGLGNARGLIRRLGAICLILMGVHAAADVLDDLAFNVIEAIDLSVDNTVAAFLAWLSSAGGMTPDAAVAAIERFATAVDLAEKDWLALRLALVTEVVLDVLLLDLAWGTRAAVGGTLVEDLVASTKQLRGSFSAFDLERFLAPITLLMLSVGGGVVVALAVEQPLRAAMSAAAPGLIVAGNIAALVALVVVGLLCWRFVPDLIHGSVVRAHERGERARERQLAKRAKHPARFPRVRNVVDAISRALRGLWLVLALFIAVAGLLGGTEVTRGQGASGLIERMGAMP
jgi:hypothetical protein